MNKRCSYPACSNEAKIDVDVLEYDEQRLLTFNKYGREYCIKHALEVVEYKIREQIGHTVKELIIKKVGDDE